MGQQAEHLLEIPDELVAQLATTHEFTLQNHQHNQPFCRDKRGSGLPQTPADVGL